MGKIKRTNTSKNLKSSAAKTTGRKNMTTTMKKVKNAASIQQKVAVTRTKIKAKKVASTEKKKNIKVNKTKSPLKTKLAKKMNRSVSQREKKLQEIRTILLRQKDSLLSGAEEALNELPEQTVFPDMGDQASAETDRSFMLKLRGREQRLLKKIDEAVDRIENGIFGICEDCGEEIDIKRLYARPVTTMCIDCKTLQEEEEKLREI